MLKILGTIAAILLVIGAFLAFKNHVAYEEGTKSFKKEQAVEKSTVREFENLLDRQKSAKDEQNVLLDKQAEATKELEKSIALHEQTIKKVESLKETHEENENRVTSLNKELQGLPDPEEFLPKIKQLNTGLVEAESSIASQEARLANLVLEQQKEKKRVEGLRRALSDYATGDSLANLKTTISSVYSNWGFVILAAGDKQGVVSGSMLDVIRGSEVIGKLKVTAVESGRASADVVYGSVPDGMTLRSGDRVIPAAKAASTVATNTSSEEDQ